MNDELICWWCVHKLPQDTPVIHLPTKYIPKEKSFLTIGNFCSWECAKAFSMNSCSTKTYEMQSLLSYMRLQALGKYVPLFAAPKQFALKCFGGTMTIDEFRSFRGKQPPPVEFKKQTHLVPEVGSVNGLADHVQMLNKNKMNAIEQATASGPTLKLKRAKPLERSKSKLESALGIKRKSSLA
jgi:hypothetical protein